MDFEHLTEIAIKAALDAGKIIENNTDSTITVKKKESGNTLASQVVTKIDHECEKVILNYLLPTCQQFNLGILSEETEDNKSRFKKDFFWCIDPLDGTLAFINKFPGFAVSIALIAKDGTPKIGVVYNPSTKTLYHAIHQQGAFKNREPWQKFSKNKYLTYVTDKKLSDTPNKDKINAMISAKLAKLGLNKWKEISGSGAVYNAILVAENTPAIFLKLPKKEKGGGSIWDFAATACIFKELGLSATNFYGKHLDLNKKENSFMNHEGVLYAS